MFTKNRVLSSNLNVALCQESVKTTNNRWFSLLNVNYGILECPPKKPFVCEKIDIKSTPKEERPYGPNLFLNKISVNCKHSNNNLYTLSLSEILSEKYGVIKESYQVKEFTILLNLPV